MTFPSFVLRCGRVRWAAVCLFIGASCTPVMVPQTSGGVALPADPAPRPFRNFSRIETEVLDALNTARTDPRAAASWVESLIPHFEGYRLRRPDWPNAVLTVEGTAAVREAIAALRAQAPTSSLRLDAALTRAARDHATDQGRTGQTGHTGSDGSSVITRVERYARWLVSINENIDYAPMVAGRDVVESLLIDDGVRDRGHRRNIFDPTSRVVGVACGPHPRYSAVCVIVQAGGVAPK